MKNGNTRYFIIFNHNTLTSQLKTITKILEQKHRNCNRYTSIKISKEQQ